MCDRGQSASSVKKHRSCNDSFSSEKSSSQDVCRSDAHIYYNDTSMTQTDSFTRSKDTSAGASHEYYKKYDHDETPVKDDISFNDHSFSEDNDLRSVNNKDSITNSDLDKLEMKIMSKISRELQTDEDDVNSLESNIKLFKTTVQQIFDNFYENMHDFELYKKKFHEILEKNKGNTFSEMEDFIRDMIQNIESSKSLISNKKVIESPQDESSKECQLNVNDMDAKVSKSANSTVETFLNDNYCTDSTLDEDSSKFNTEFKSEETYNIFVMSGNPYVQIKMNNRNMLSEINIRDKNIGSIENQLASAENLKKLAAKKLQIKNYRKLQLESPCKDRDIPVKIASAKKNIHLDEDFTCVEKGESKFFIFKICSYICKKLRKNVIS
ncbi:repetitive organellar protein-like [Maniola hyperantus]|uniref:repetitive organellar protein-like n=1 Tax=Aphantopus hyperantus TaxID=2795564 RepID=UPI00156A12CD|nr:uncharacterized protein LOC117993787 [Maniola hyperantus]